MTTEHETVQSLLAKIAELEGERDEARAKVAELQNEAELFDEDHADHNRMVDRIADLIGLPHDQVLDTTAFELWFSEIDQRRQALLAERDAASARVGEMDQKLRRLEAALRVARGYVLRATDEQSFRDQVTIDAALEIKA